MIKLLKKKYIATKCGHKTCSKGTVNTPYGKYKTKMPVINDKVEYCLDCIGKMTICCAWCGGPIFIGDPITLYSPTKRPKHLLKKGVITKSDAERNNNQFKAGGVVYDEKTMSLVGCLRMNCADTGADRAGFWVPSDDKIREGTVHRIMSPIEQCMATGKQVIVDDLKTIKNND